MLLIISAKVAHSLWRYFCFSAEYTAVSPSVNKPPRTDAKTFDKNDVQLISQQNWFGKYQPVAAPVKQPEPAPVAETRLNVVLRGIAFGARPGAVIEEGGKQQVYLQGERLGSHNAVIEEINRDHVMLRYQGKIERLSLAEEERSTVAVTNKKAVSDEAKQAVAEPAVSAPVEIPTAVRQALAKDPQKIFNYIQLTPVRKEGIVGYAVKPGADRSLFDASGFKEGDIAIALNQQDFTDPRAMIALMRQLPSMDYSKAEDLVDVLKQVSGTLTAAKEEAEGTVGSGREVVSIAASKHSNALIVTAPQDIMQSLQSVIEQLDIRRAQVHVEALIVEVAEGSNINFGVQWASKDAGLMQFANGTQIPIGTLGAAISQAKPQKGSTVISENGATTINPDTNGDLSTLAQLLSGFSGTAVGVVKGDWMALVQAVKNDSSSNVLSTPSITTLDNQEAFFMVGQDVPVLTGSTVGSNNSNPFNTVERKKVGIMLKVTPQINEGNAVQMVIEQEVSKVEGQTSLDVVFGERKLKTTVLANDGELIVLGGLMDDQAGESVAKVPLLGDIPLIGNLFKSTADKKEKRNLMVFIRPTILRDGMAADGVSQRKYNYMRAEQIYRDEQGLSLMPHTAQPVLPAQNQALPPEVRAFLNAGRTR